MSDKIIQFPGGNQPAEDDQPATPTEGSIGNVLGLQLSPDQEKALQVVMSGMSFVCVGIQPTESGADFFTAIHGDAADLTNAQPHLGGVIDRAFDRQDL